MLFQVSFQAVPYYLQRADVLFALRAFGGLVLLLVWLYLMANVIVIGAEINWRHWARHQPPEEEELSRPGVGERASYGLTMRRWPAPGVMSLRRPSVVASSDGARTIAFHVAWPPVRP